MASASIVMDTVFQVTSQDSVQPDHDRSRSRPQPGVLFRAAVYGGSGYADGNLINLAGILNEKIPAQVLPIGETSDKKELLAPGLRARLEELQKSQVDLTRGIYYQCCPAVDFDLQIEARIRIGRTTFETDRIPDGWKERCNALDQVWVPCRQNYESFAKAGVKESKLVIMPEGLDTELYRPSLEPLPVPGRRGFNFVSVFDWIDRKGPDILLRAYLTEFKPDEDVTLILKVHKFDDPSAMLEARLLYFIERVLKLRVEDCPPIIVISGLLPANEMPRLYATGDAFVVPSRGEGWGRPYMEAAACEKIVLAPRWGGPVDFLDDSNAFLIDIEGMVPVPTDSDREIYIGHRWSEPSADHLRQLMRSVFAHQTEARQRAHKARADMVQKWDWRVMAKFWGGKFRELLDQVQE